MHSAAHSDSTLVCVCMYMDGQRRRANQEHLILKNAVSNYIFGADKCQIQGQKCSPRHTVINNTYAIREILATNHNDVKGKD